MVAISCAVGSSRWQCRKVMGPEHIPVGPPRLWVGDPIVPVLRALERLCRQLNLMSLLTQFSLFPGRPWQPGACVISSRVSSAAKHKIWWTNAVDNVSVTYYPLKKQRSLTDWPRTAITSSSDENAFTGPKGVNGLATHDSRCWITKHLFLLTLSYIIFQIDIMQIRKDTLDLTARNEKKTMKSLRNQSLRIYQVQNNNIWAGKVWGGRRALCWLTRSCTNIV